MNSLVSQAHRDEEKLGLILGQLGKVRRRLNSLAIQRGIFESLALAVGTAALVFAGAMLLGPLPFIAVAALLGVVLFLGVAAAARRAWRMRADGNRAAALADLRAGLKGRLTTIVALTSEWRRRGPLWGYLLEDTLALREEFTAARIERRRVSPSIYAFLLYCVLAALVVPLAMLGHRARLLANTPAEMELDVNDLDVRPASPDADAGVDVSGDSTAMRKLADKLARFGDAQEGQAGTLGKLMGQARDLAVTVQNKLTGGARGRPRIHLRLTDSAANEADQGAFDPPHKRRSGDRAGQFQNDQKDRGIGSLPPVESAPEPLANRDREGGGLQVAQEQAPGGNPANRELSNEGSRNDQGDSEAGGGSSHGSGSDPQHLFGSAEEPPIGSEGFQIMIEARPAERGPRGENQAYVPPKVRASLNPLQQPDRPIARSDVPEEDRAEIKRVYER